MALKILSLSPPDTGSSVQFGADDLDKVTKLLSGVDLTTASSDIIDIATQWKFRDQMLRLNDPSNTRRIIVKTTAGMAADRTATIPALAANDSFLFANQTQTITGKTIDYNSNTILNLPTAPGGSANTAVAQTWTALQTFMDGDFALRNPADTFSTVIKSGAQSASQTFTFPITSSDTILTAAASQAVTNKNISGSLNTISNLPKSALPTTTLYSDVDNSLGIHYLAISGMTAPGSPAAGTVRVYADTVDSHLKIKHANGSITDLDALGGGGGSGGIFGPSYIIYIDGAGRVNALNGITGVTDFSSASAPATSAETRSVFNSVFAALATTGGLVYIKRGTYLINGQVVIGATSSPSAHTVVQGEGWATKIKFDAAAAASDIFKSKAIGTFRDIEFDGDGKAAQLLWSSDPGYLYVIGCHFINGDKQCLQTFSPHPSGGGNDGIIVDRCWFDRTGDLDQCAVGSDEFAIITNCVFDRRLAGNGSAGGGSTQGPMLTSGGVNEFIVKGNTFYNIVTNLNSGVSVEPWGTDYHNVVIDGNTFVDCRCLVGGIVGGAGDWSSTEGANPTTIRNVNIIGNVMSGFGIMINGKNTMAVGDETGGLNMMNIANNIIYDSYWAGVAAIFVPGPMSIHDNTIIDSNFEGSANDNGLINIQRVNRTEVYSNNLKMTTAAANKSRYGILYNNGCTHLRIHDNKVSNIPGTNPSITSTFLGSASDIEIWDNYGYITNNEGATPFTASGSNATFTVNHGLAVTPLQVIYSTTNNSGAPSKVQNLTSTSFDIVYTSNPPAGTITIYWRASKRVFA